MPIKRNARIIEDEDEEILELEDVEEHAFKALFKAAGRKQKTVARELGVSDTLLSLYLSGISQLKPEVELELYKTATELIYRLFDIDGILDRLVFGDCSEEENIERPPKYT